MGGKTYPPNTYMGVPSQASTKRKPQYLIQYAAAKDWNSLSKQIKSIATFVFF